MRLNFLRPVYGQAGPCACVYLDTGRDAENAPHAIGLRWRGAAEQLAAAGCDEATLRAIEEVVTGASNAAPGRAIFGRDGQVVHTEPLPRPPQRDYAAWTAVPHLLPLLDLREEPVPHVRVLTDREGADIWAFGSHGERAETVRGSQWPVQKVSDGGWSEARFQRSAVETWRHNAAQVAEAVAAEAAACGACMIVMGGDIRARELVLAELPEADRKRTVIAEHGGRSAGASQTTWDDAVRSQLQAWRDARREDVITAFGGGLADGRAVTGLADVVSAAQQGQLDVLFIQVPDSPFDDRTGELWFGPEPGQLAISESELVDLGASERATARASEVLIRAAVGTDAGAEIVRPDELKLGDRVGALLRFAL
jgi:Bacterial archaeo-eukaryotic release factor family 2